tara:strand:- start:1798 stop:2982 length:1185 start_codon:yes stop_codon:yes gene_type:complete
MKININSYLIHSSVLMPFLQGFVIRDVFFIDLKLFYLVMAINFGLLLPKIKISTPFLANFLFLIIHGLLGVVYFKFPISPLISQLVGVLISFIYFSQIIKLYDVKVIFNLYLKYASFFVIISLLLFPFNILDLTPDRLDGIMTEPSKFVLVNIPAFYYFLAKRNIPKIGLFLVAFLLSSSSAGFLAIILMILFLILSMKSIKHIILIFSSSIIMIALLINNEHFNKRLNSTVENLKALKTHEFKNDTNVSTLVLLKSAIISVKNLKDHPFGTGLGSYQHIHDTYLNEIKLPRYAYHPKSIAKGLNKTDANSLGLRIISDFGIFGVLAIFLFFIYAIFSIINSKNLDSRYIQIGLFIYLIIKLFRMGHYFPEEFFLFLLLFFSNFKVILKKQHIE